MSYLDALPARYRLILCDVWGVVHDGVTIFPGSAERLLQWEGEGRTVILLTNAPRTEEAVAAQLDRLGLPRRGIVAVTMPGFGTTARTRGNAEALTEELGVTLRTIPIDP